MDPARIKPNLPVLVFYSWVVISLGGLLLLPIAHALWGIAGAFIGVPILIALATICVRHPLPRPIAALLWVYGSTQAMTERC